MSINKNKELLPYYEKARELLSYNPDTGFFTWKVKVAKNIKVGDKAGSENNHGYIQIQVNGKLLLAHRLSWYFIHNELPNVIDHINHTKDDNRIINLRFCTQAENLRNQGKQSNNTSGYKGVSWHKPSRKWVAKININGKRKYLGSFNCPKEASEAYENKAKELFGEFYINNN